MKRLLASLAVVAAMVLPVSAATITDNFSDGDYTNNPAWTVDSGDFTADGTQAAGSMYGIANVLNFGTAPGTQIHLDFGAVQPNTAASVEFQLIQTNGAAGTNFTFSFGLEDSVSGLNYIEEGCLNPNAYGNPPSGFHSYNSVGQYVGVTEPQSSLTNGWMTIGMTFDPITGVTVTKDGVQVASWSNFHNLTQVDRLVLRGNGTVSWFVDDVTVNYVPEPATMSLLGLATLMVLKRRRA